MVYYQPFRLRIVSSGARNSIMKSNIAFVLTALAACILLLMQGCSRKRAESFVDLCGRPEFTVVGSNKEAVERGVSFEFRLANGKVFFRRREFEPEAVADELSGEFAQARLTPEEASRAPVFMTALTVGAKYSDMMHVLDGCARLGLKTIGFMGAFNLRSEHCDTPVRLPIVANGVEVEPDQLDAHRPKNWIVVDLRARGTAYVNDAGPFMLEAYNGKALSFQHKIKEIADSVSEARMKINVLIRADEQVPCGFVHRVMSECAGCGYWEFFFLGRKADGTTCIVAHVELPCPNGFWWGNFDGA